MVATDKLFAGSIPEIYDRLLVPLIFEPYARDLAARLATVEPRDVLETAAGTGVLTRAIASRLPAQARIDRDRSQPADARSCDGEDSPMMIGSRGGRPMRSPCRSRIKRLTSWRASSP